MRNEAGIEKDMVAFEQIRKEKIPLVRARDQRGWIKGLECANLAWVGEMVTRSALERRESRGQHYREDYPGKLKGLPSWTKVYKKDDLVAYKVEAIPLGPGDMTPPV